MRETDKLDEFDLRLLALLQEDARHPIPALAEQVGLSAPACYRRIRRLRESGARATWKAVSTHRYWFRRWARRSAW